MSDKKCLVPICLNRTSNKDKIFITVPRNPDVQKRWWVAMKITDKNYFRGVVCEDHFNLETDAENWMKYKIIGARLKIKEGVVPHKFIEKGPEVEISSSLSNSAKKRKLENLSRLKDNTPSTSRGVCRLFGEESSPKKLKLSSPSGSFSIEEEDIFLKPTRTVSTQTAYKDLIKIKAVVEKSCSPFKEQPIKHKTKIDPIQESSSPSIIPSTSSETFSLSSSSTEETRSVLIKRLESTKKLIEADPKFYLGIPNSLIEVVNILSKYCNILPEHIIICLYKIKMDDQYLRIARDFDLSTSTIHRIFTNNVSTIAGNLKQLIFWPSSDKIKAHLPLSFQARYNKVESIIDCFEIEIQKPGSPIMQSSTWSEYKHCNTIKFLVSCTPTGFINFVSEGFGGRISDTDIIIKSGYLNQVKDCDVMADRGFKHIASLLKEKNCNLIRPPSVGTQQSSASEVKLSKQIASLRIHIERVIRRIREFSMLRPHACINNNLLHVLNDVVIIVCAIINLQKPLL